MEPNSGKHSDTSQPRKTSNTTAMDYTLVLLFSLLHVFSVGTAAPVPADVAKMKSKVKWMAEQLVVRINKDFQAPPGLTLSPLVDDLDGLSSVVSVLEGYNSLIADSLDDVTQIKYDISSLTGYLSKSGARNCSDQRPKQSVPGPLQELQSRKEFIHTVSLEALLRVKDFLNLLLKKLDSIKIC